MKLKWARKESNFSLNSESQVKYLSPFYSDLRINLIPSMVTYCRDKELILKVKKCTDGIKR